jgi:hypothetical protein
VPRDLRGQVLEHLHGADHPDRQGSDPPPSLSTDITA